jgi:hypothetical protein
MAQAALDSRRPGACRVHFAFMCAHCGARCVLQEANTLYQRGKCHKCGLVTTIRRAGFIVVEG